MINFCSNCGSADVKYIIPAGDNRQRHACMDCGFIHYINPRIIVGCLPVYRGKILLCRRNIEPRKGLWNLPSGFMECGETTQEGAIRETYEESKAEVEIIKLHAVYNLPHADQVYLHFLAEMKSDHFEVTPESSEVKLFAPEEIPFDKMAFSSSTFSISKYIENPDPNDPTVHIGTYKKSNDKK